MKKLRVSICSLAVITLPLSLHASVAAVSTPQVQTVLYTGLNEPAQGIGPTTPHESWSGNQVTLKGVVTSPNWGTDTFTYDWDPGDGGSHCTGTVTNQWDVECQHTYTGSVGTGFTAVLKVTDTTNNTVSGPYNCPPTITQGGCYYTKLFGAPPNLPVEVANAIDNGLWLLHKNMRHFTTTGGAAAGDWYLGNGNEVDAASAGGTGPSALDCSAFQVSSFLQTNSFPNPYSNDVQLCLTGVFNIIGTTTVSAAFDQNANGIGVQSTAPYEDGQGGSPNYQTGMIMDSIVSSGTPSTVIPAGTNLATEIAAANIKGTGAGGAYTYKDAVFDMVDAYTYCEAPGDVSFGVPNGGWHYYCQEENGDNSVSQWAAIGIIPALRTFGSAVPAQTHADDEAWLDYSFTNNAPTTGYNGYFGYTSSSPLWGPYADTPSGLVQLAMNGLGRGTVSPGGHHLWDSAETFLRDNFGTAQSAGAGSSLKDYYYGMFSFTKAMLLHDNNDGANPKGSQNVPLATLHSTDDPGTCSSPVPIGTPGTGNGPCYPDIDWYAAQTSAYGGTDATNGVARTILSNQNADGSWFGQNYTGAQNYFQTAISIIMLNKTVTNLLPVACFTVNPTAGINGGTYTLNASCSYDNNPNATIVTYQWDVSGTGAGFTIGPGNAACVTASCSEIKYKFSTTAKVPPAFNFPVRLEVTDNAAPAQTAQVTGAVVISAPPIPPVSNPGGPYTFCPNTNANGALIYSPFLLNGSASTDPDPNTGAAITSYEWFPNNSCTGSPIAPASTSPYLNVAAAPYNYANLIGTTQICLQVTSNEQTLYPGQVLPPSDYTSTQSTTATVVQTNPQGAGYSATAAEACTHCVNTLTGHGQVTAGKANVQLYWTDTNSAQFPIDHYNIYRSLAANFVDSSTTQIAGAASNPFVPAVKVSASPGGQLYFQDIGPLATKTTYYYRVSPATANDTETCQGNVTLVVTVPGAVVF